jgi:Polyketide cyclase / dehydrase and lipid transport
MDNLRIIQTEVEINATKAKAWEALFTQFGEIYLFNPNLEGSHFSGGSKGEVGCERVCQLDAKTTIKEKIVSADELNNFRVEIIGGNIPFVNTMLVDIKLHAIDSEKTRVEIEAGFNTKPGFMAILMKSPFKKKIKDMLIGLKYYLETGKKVSKKTYKPIFKSYKKLELSESF